MNEMCSEKLSHQNIGMKLPKEIYGNNWIDTYLLWKTEIQVTDTTYVRQR